MHSYRDQERRLRSAIGCGGLDRERAAAAALAASRRRGCSVNKQTILHNPTQLLVSMAQEKKDRPKLDLDAEALTALEEARALAPGPERTEAMKRAGILRNAADLQGLFFAKRGRPTKR